MSKLASGFPDEIDDRELLARFVTSSGNYVKTTGRVKHTTFLPDKKDDETSVFRIEGLDEVRISQIGIANIPGGYFHGAAIIRADLVRRQALIVTSDEPPDRHGVFRGWPIDNDQDIQRAKRMNVAQVLAEEATFLRKTE